MTSYVDRLVASPDGLRSYQQERAIYEATNLIEEEMQKQGISRNQLAQKLGKTKGWVTQLLDGEANKTIRTVADVLCVLGFSLHFCTGPLAIDSIKPSSDIKVEITVPQTRLNPLLFHPSERSSGSSATLYELAAG